MASTTVAYNRPGWQLSKVNEGSPVTAYEAETSKIISVTFMSDCYSRPSLEHLVAVYIAALTNSQPHQVVLKESGHIGDSRITVIGVIFDTALRRRQQIY